MKKKTLQDVIDYVKENHPGAQVVSKEYVVGPGKLELICESGHEFGISYGHLVSGRWCRFCKSSRTKATCQKLYGADHHSRSDSVREKTKNTCRERYGCGCSLQDKSVREKRDQTMIDRYGESHPLRNKELADKARETRRVRARQTSEERLREIIALVKEKHPTAKVSCECYWNKKTKICVTCENGHVFQTVYANLVKGAWCGLCRKQQRRESVSESDRAAARDKKIKKKKEWHEAHKEEVRFQRWQWSIKRRYGLTADEYYKIFNKQGGRCAICGRNQSGLKVKLMVDHDHATGRVRGLLCGDCNKGIGLICDNKDIMSRAARYLGGDRGVPDCRQVSPPVIKKGFPYHLRRKYGLTIEKYNEMFCKQGGCCAICCRKSEGFKTNLSVDHDHATGEVRGLLCGDCNRMIGMFHDLSRLLAKAAYYLEGRVLKFTME